MWRWFGYIDFVSVSIRNLGTVIIVYSYLLSCVKNYIIWNRLAGVIYHEREKEKKRPKRKQSAVWSSQTGDCGGKPCIVGEDLFATKNHIIGHRGEVSLSYFRDFNCQGRKKRSKGEGGERKRTSSRVERNKRRWITTLFSVLFQCRDFLSESFSAFFWFKSPWRHRRDWK